jgi:7-carboxy-7-deazaguanine synthase
VSTLAEELNQVDTAGVGQLAVSKDGLFGPTFQGEGPSLGRYCYFLRLAGCNQHCVWCDTPYTWAFSDRLAALHRDGVKYDPREEVHKASVEDILDDLKHHMSVSEKPSMLVISGGEPMLQQQRLVPLVTELVHRGWRIEIETAGTVYPLRELAFLVDQFNVSVKLENSGNPLASRYRPRVIEALQETGVAAWKFVATSKDDLAEIRHLVVTHRLKPVYVMPEGIVNHAINHNLRELAQAVLDEGWNLTTRLQIEIWGNKRGV